MNRQSIKTIEVRQLYDLSRNGSIELIDVRTPEEYREVHAATARNVPMNTIDPHAFMHGRGSSVDEPIYLICQMGGRSGRVCEAFLAAGYANVVNVVGGTEAWIDAGLPVE